MYLTPVFYRSEAVPEGIRRWLYLNPMVSLLDAWRDVLLHGRWPNFADLSLLTVVVGVLLLAGRRAFRRESRRFMEEL
jgi:lipopolysaccharide transport system permease protein